MDYKFTVEFLDDAKSFIDKLPKKEREIISGSQELLVTLSYLKN